MSPIGRAAATAREYVLALPGDELIPRALDSLTHAVTVPCGRNALWPWLTQMGEDRVGWYSNDRAIFRGLPGECGGFVPVEQETHHWLVLGWPSETGGYTVTWAFVLREIAPNLTRLIVRVRARDDYPFRGLPWVLGLWLARLVHVAMQRKQLPGFARRVERLAS